MGQVSSQSGVQQGDPLGPMLFALVLHKLVQMMTVFTSYWKLGTLTMESLQGRGPQLYVLCTLLKSLVHIWVFT